MVVKIRTHCGTTPRLDHYSLKMRRKSAVHLTMVRTRVSLMRQSPQISHTNVERCSQEDHQEMSARERSIVYCADSHVPDAEP